MSEDKVGKDNLTVKSYFCNVCSKSYAYKHTFQRYILFMEIMMDLNVYSAISVLNAMM